MAKLNFELSSEIIDEYEVVNTHLPILESKIGRIDFRSISKTDADILYQLGSIYLKKKNKKSKVIEMQ